jgi:hypothetical protein
MEAAPISIWDLLDDAAESPVRADLESSLKLSRVRLWMGLLHSPDALRLEQTGDFYDEGGIFINLKG